MTAFHAETGDETTWPQQEERRHRESLKGPPMEVENLTPPRHALEKSPYGILSRQSNLGHRG